MRRWIFALLSGLLLGTVLSAQGTLSNQVLQLLTRVNSWTATNTFLDLRLIKGVPSDTLLRFYVDSAGSLYFNGAQVTGPGGVTNPHNLLSTTHADTLAAAVTRGAVVVGNATPAWARLALCPSGNYVGSNGTDTVCATSAAAFTAIPAAQITGTAGAFDGNAITNLNATNLGSGTVPLARLSGILNAQIAAGAAIAYSKLNLAASLVNTDVAAGAAIAYSKLALTGSVVTGDLAAATLLFDRWASNGCVNLQVPQYNGASWVCKSLTHTDLTDGGTVLSVAMTVPTGFSVSGSPITASGTLAVTLSTETANTVWAGPTTGAATTPTFRALVNADLPLSGVGAGTYPKVTVNTAGVVTAALSQITLTTDVTGTLPRANGGTGVAVSGDDTVLVGSGTAWVAQTLPDCTTGALNYAQSTNLFSCSTSPATHNLLSATHADTLAGAVVRGDMIVGNSTPAWARVAKGTQGTLWTMGANDPSWSATVAAGTLTSSTPWTWTQTWNAGGVAFVGVSLAFTETASAAGSTYFQILGGAGGATSEFAVGKGGATTVAGLLKSSSPSGGIGYATGAGCAVTQGTSRTTGVTCTGVSGAITLVSAAGSATPATFTVTDTSVAATDTIVVNEKSGTDLYEIFVTNITGGTFNITFFTTGGTTNEQPVFNFTVIKGVTS